MNGNAVVDRLRGMGCKPKRNGNGWMALCPAHNDHNPSLRVWTGPNDRAMVKCFAGCDYKLVLDRLGMSDNGKARTVAPERMPNEYTYHDETGNALFQVVRFPNKKFRQRRPCGEDTAEKTTGGGMGKRSLPMCDSERASENGNANRRAAREHPQAALPGATPGNGVDGGRTLKWVWGMDGVRRVLYRLPRVVKAVEEGDCIYVVEGEKDVHTLERHGLIATTCPGGAGKWRDEYSAVLKNADVIVLPDNDTPGRDHADDVARSLTRAGAIVHVVELAELPEKGDVTDWFDNGGTVEGLEWSINRTQAHVATENTDNAKNNSSWHGKAKLTHVRTEQQSIALENMGKLALPHATNDTGNAERFVDMFGADVRFNVSTGKWLLWNGQRWQQDEARKVLRLAIESARAIDETEYAKWRNTSLSENKLRSLLSVASALPGIPILPSDLDRDPMLINVENGTVDLRTGELRDHERSDMITKLAPVEYDLDAECPQWDAFLNEIMDDDQPLIDFLRRMAGYAMTASVQEQKIFFLYGTGANGKSTFVSTLLKLMGDYARPVDSEIFMQSYGNQHPTGMADLDGTRLAVAEEFGEGRRLAESRVKQLTGGDKLVARKMRQDFFQFDPTHKLVVCTNYKPVIRGTDHGIWRRIVLVPFLKTIEPEHQDKLLGEKLKTELPGIFQWCLQGATAWHKYDLDRQPNQISQATDQYRTDQDILGQFISDCCIVSPDEEVTSKALRKVYTTWCEENGERPMTATALGRKLSERSFVSVRRMGARTWQGIGPKHAAGCHV